jgi:hypothetical protein
MVGLNVRKWGFYDKTVKNFKPFCWWDAFRSVWMAQQNAPIENPRSKTKSRKHPEFCIPEFCGDSTHVFSSTRTAAFVRILVSASSIMRVGTSSKSVLKQPTVHVHCPSPRFYTIDSIMTHKILLGTMEVFLLYLEGPGKSNNPFVIERVKIPGTHCWNLGHPYRGSVVRDTTL